MTALLQYLFGVTRPARLLFCLVALAWSATAGASPLDLDGGEVSWSRLTFRPADRPDELEVEVRLSEPTGEQLAALFGSDSGDGTAPPAEGTVWQMTSTIDVRYTGQVYRTDIWFQPEAASPLQRHRDKLGGDASRKAYRYLADGVRRQRVEPDGAAEADAAPEQWSRIKEEFFPYGPSLDGCPVLTDPSLLFLVAASGAVTRADGPMTLCVFNKKTIYRVRLSAGPVETLQANYLELKGAARTEVRGPAKVRTIRIEAAAPEDGGIEPESFEFFEMSGEIEIDLAAETGLPLRISGEIPGFGRAVFLLSEAEMRR
jgi:hypothetical protein